MDDITIKIDSDYDTVRRMRKFLVNNKLVGKFHFDHVKCEWFFEVEGKSYGMGTYPFDPNAGICDKLDETILQAMLDELKRLNATYRGV